MSLYAFSALAADATISIPAFDQTAPESQSPSDGAPAHYRLFKGRLPISGSEDIVTAFHVHFDPMRSIVWPGGPPGLC